MSEKKLDIVERLRRPEMIMDPSGAWAVKDGNLLFEAADEIERLRSRIDTALANYPYDARLVAILSGKE